MNRDEFLVCREYASMDLAFSMYNLHEMIHEEDESLKDLCGAPEKGYYDWFIRVLKDILSLEDAGSGADEQLAAAGQAESELRELRHENKKRMEFLTVLTDRLIAYEYVLNRFELKYAPESELNEFLKTNPEDAFLNKLIIYLTKDKDKKIFGTKLQSVIGEIPVQITKAKLFEWIDRAFTLYLDSDETALDELIYMLRMVGLVNEPGEYLGEYPRLEAPLRHFEETELSEMDSDTYDKLRDEIFNLSGSLQYIMDYYSELERCVNDALSLCLVRKWLPADDALMGEDESAAIGACVGEDAPDESLFVALEGRIEGIADRLHKQMAKVEAPDMNAEEEEVYLDVATLARLLSNSLYAEIDPIFVESRVVTKELIKEKEDVLFDEIGRAMKSSQRPVRKAIQAKILEKLPPFITSQEEIESYVRVNLFNCRDKAERCAVMALLIEMMDED